MPKPTQRSNFHDHYTPEPNSGCWLWLRKVDRDGYGRMWTGDKEIGAHRWSYTARYGPVESAVQILHRCDTPSCVNPDHLFAGTPSDNMLDAVNKGRLTRSGRKLTAETRERIICSPLARNATARTFGVSTRTVQMIWKQTRFKAGAIN